MVINNNKKNPNDLHDYLMKNDCIPKKIEHNANYNLEGEKIEEATEIYIEIEEEKVQKLIGLVNQFMSQ